MTENPKQKNQQDKRGGSHQERGGKSRAELAAAARMLPESEKDQLIPPIGHIIFTFIQTAKDKTKRLVFQVSHRYPAKARFTCELLGSMDEPRPEAARVAPADPNEPITLDVHDGVIGGGSKFNR